MALWWAHLRVAERAHAQLAHLDLTELKWGAICPDVDKVSSVARELSHYSAEAPDPEDFIDAVGLEPAVARAHRSFLAGYLSHLAMDEAWYAHLGRLLAEHPIEGWGRQSARAWNVAVDVGLAGDPFTPPEHRIEHVLPHLRDTSDTMRMAAVGYTSWTTTPMEGPDGERAAALLEHTGTSRLLQECEDFVVVALRRFLDDLERRC
ncbi:MAG TPA: hypothetical protein QGF58_14775 [Myxococcota bacterium]|nr:hypothetical protein [Myxococcota bacterium]